MSEKILIYDIETAVASTRPNAEKDFLRLFGCYSYITDKYYFITKEESIRKTINAHDYLVGFHNLIYDNTVLKNFGFAKNLFRLYNPNFNAYQYYFNGKTNIDLYQVFDKRSGIIVVNDQNLNDILLDYKLDTICKTLGITGNNSGKIKTFDYNLLKKARWTNDEWEEIKEYTKRDLEITKKLYEWLEDYFATFKDLVSPENRKKKTYIHSSPSAFAYKAVCHHLKIEEEYDDKGKGAGYGGGYVAYPAGESFDLSMGDIYLLDFNSLYPHINLMCNLFCPSDNGWNGNGLFKTDRTYDDKNQGMIEQYLLETYIKRDALKKVKDPRQYALKIVLNSIYGMSSSAKFKKIYRKNTAPDCTALGRQWIFLARKMFKEAGYKNLYSDTDSCFILDPFKDKQKMLSVKDRIIDEIKANVPFPSDTFDMSIDDEITNLWFFKSRKKSSEEDTEFMDCEDKKNIKNGLLKKNYLYRTTDGNIVVKNLGVRKKSTSKITRHIFWNILIPDIKKKCIVKFPKPYFWEKIQQILNDDLSMAATRYAVNAYESYKPPRSGIHAQIAQRYGPGIHFLIPNKKGVGVGKKKSYCSFDEFKKQGLGIDDIELENVWNELDYFIETKGIIYLGNQRLPRIFSFLQRIFGNGKKELQRAG